MSKRDFQKYMCAYVMEYYSAYSSNLELVGDHFFMMSDDEFSQWFTSHHTLYSFEKTNAPTPRISSHSNSSKELPAYAIALHELFYEELKETDEQGQNLVRERHVELTQKRVSEVCHVARSSISNWENGVTVPKKYSWWALAIGLLELNYQDIVPYMDMIGCTVDMTCKDDIILFYSMCKEKSIMEIYCLLKKYHCQQTMQYFTPAQNNLASVELTQEIVNYPAE